MMPYSMYLKTTEQLTQYRFLEILLDSAWQKMASRLLSELSESGVSTTVSAKANSCFTIVSNSANDLTAIKYERKCRDAVIIREYVLNEPKQLLTIHTSIKSSSLQPINFNGLQNGIPKVVHRLMDERFLDTDDGFPVSKGPIHITDDNSEYFRSLLDGTVCPRLPIVCFTPSILGKYPIDIDEISLKLFGRAHIVIPESRRMMHSFKIAGINPAMKHGRVCIFNTITKAFKPITLTLKDKCQIEQVIQNVTARYNTFPSSDILSFDQVYNQVLCEQLHNSKATVHMVVNAKNLAEEKNSRLLLHLDEELMRLKEEAMDSALQEAEQIVCSYEADIIKLREELNEKKFLLQRLEVENQRLRTHLDGDKIPIIYLGEEQEFYLGEIQDIILATLEDALSDIPEKSRKHDIISDILMSNNYKHISKDRNEQIKHLLRGYNGMSAKVRHGLEELGFLVEETNKHCKISYHGDDRYLVVFGSTPSDVRSGKNNAATLVRMAY